jgi:hypothetical protein
MLISLLSSVSPIAALKTSQLGSSSARADNNLNAELNGSKNMNLFLYAE